MFEQAEIIATNGIELEVFSDGSGKPVVLCHGWPEHAFSWRHQTAPLAQAGYHVIAPNQRGYGHSSKPDAVTDYDIEHLTGDLVGLLDHFGYDDAVFVGHDWGAIVVWNLAIMHPDRVAGVINLSVPFMARGKSEWVGGWEERLGGDFYIVHFNRQPGVADAVFDANPEQFLRNMYRTNQWLENLPNLGPGMPLVNMATAEAMPGDLLMSEEELAVFVDAFKTSGFTGGLNWYRNFSRNWTIIGDYEQRVGQPTLMIYGEYDSVPKSPDLSVTAATPTTETFDCGHWIQQERPQHTSQAMIRWLKEFYPA